MSKKISQSNMFLTGVESEKCNDCGSTGRWTHREGDFIVCECGGTKEK